MIDQAVTDVATQRGRIGAFQANTIQSGINGRQVAIENVAAAEATIRNADFATEIVNARLAQLGLEASVAAFLVTTQTQSSLLKLFAS